MTYDEQTELLNLTRENNILLKIILKLIDKDESNDFATNILANLVASRIEELKL